MTQPLRARRDTAAAHGRGARRPHRPV